jgi:protein ImuA
LHEVFAETAPDAVCAAGFAAALAVRIAGDRPVLWARQDYADVEAGGLYGPGLVELGLDPGRLIVVRTADAQGVLRAGADAARCPALGAVLLEPWGEAKALDLTASRRLALAAGQSGVTLLMIRAAAQPRPSAAMTRWSVRPRLSRALEAVTPGFPAFTLTLLRHRAGRSEQTFDVEWDRDRAAFTDLAPLSGRLAAPVAGGALGEAEPPLRRAG